MQLRSVNVGPKPNVWSAATGDLIEGDVVEHFLGGGERPISRTSAEEAESEADRLTLEWMYGLAQGGYSLHRVTEANWPELVGQAGYVFEGAEDGMSDHNSAVETYMSFVGYGYPVISEFPATIEGTDEDDPGVWELEKVYNASDEIECPWCGTGTGNEDSREDCDMCDGDGLLHEPYHRIALYKWVASPEDDEDE